MADNFTLIAESRADVGKGASRRLRHRDMVPAIIYGVGKPPTSISLDHKKFAKALESEAFYSHILSLELAGQEEKVVLKDVQRHPYKPRILHADFQRISANEKLNMYIQLHFKGADVAPGVKQKGGVVSYLLTEVEIRCLPANLPEYIEVDLSNLNLDQTIHLSDLVLPKDTEILGLVAGGDNDKPIVSIHMPRVVVEEVPGATAAPAAVETVAEAKAKAAAAAEAELDAATGGKKK